MSWFNTYREYSRIVEEVILTERGLYQKDDAPEDVEVKVTIDAVHAITFAEQSGALKTYWMDVPETQNKDDETGGGYNLDGANVSNHEYLPDQQGPNTVRSILTTQISTKMDSINKDAVVKVLAIKEAAPE